jgi:hypothetical protein
LIVPTLVLSEVDYWCRERLTPAAWLAFLDDVLAGVYRNEPYTDEALSEVDHPLAQAAVGAILDELRAFIDKWHGHRGRRWSPPHHWDRDEGERERDFFQDLRELRGRMRIFVGMLTELVPEAKAPRLLGDE